MVAFSKDPDLHKTNQQLDSISHAMGSVGDRLGLNEGERSKIDKEAGKLGHEILRDRLARASTDTRDGVYRTLSYGVKLAKSGGLSKESVRPIKSAFDALQRTHHSSYAPHEWSDGTYHKEPPPRPGQFHPNYAPHKQPDGSFGTTYTGSTVNVAHTTPTSTSEKLSTEEPINTKRCEWKEVPRSCPVAFIGDLHGNFQAYTENMKSAGLINDTGEWIGGNTKVIFVGDVLGDRNKDGFKIAKEIQKLGDRSMHLAGNHEDFLISALIGTTAGHGGYALEEEHGSPLEYPGFVREISSVLPDELRLKFQSATTSREKANIIRDNRDALVQNLKTKYPDVLEYILSLKLCERIHDHMVTHTPPTQEMIKYLLSDEHKGNVDSINRKYQELLQRLLIDSDCTGEKRQKAIQELRVLQKIFLETGNTLLGKTKAEDSQWKAVRNHGINSWAYGHDSDARKMASHNAGTTNRDGTTLIPVDTGEFKSNSGNMRSIAICDQQGRITVGTGVGEETRFTYKKTDSTTGRTIARE